MACFHCDAIAIEVEIKIISSEWSIIINSELINQIKLVMQEER